MLFTIYWVGFVDSFLHTGWPDQLYLASLLIYSLLIAHMGPLFRILFHMDFRTANIETKGFFAAAVKPSRLLQLVWMGGRENGVGKNCGLNLHQTSQWALLRERFKTHGGVLSICSNWILCKIYTTLSVSIACKSGNFGHCFVQWQDLKSIARILFLLDYRIFFMLIWRRQVAFVWIHYLLFPT